MPDPTDEPEYKDPRKEDIYAGDRRISRPDASIPDWEVPDSSYRPIPIVWFTGAFLVQICLLMMLAFLLVAFSPILLIGMMGMVTGAIGAWTWQRGMASASKGWKAATIITLALIYILFCVEPILRL